jgi:predicted nucleotidyltransferase
MISGYTVPGAIMATTALAQKVRAALEALAPTQEKVDLAVKAAIEVASPSRVILFGSWARGEAKWDSDLDLAVLLPNSAESELPNLHRSLRGKLREIPMSIDLVMFTEGLAQQFGQSINSIYYGIFKDGKVAYELRPENAGPDTPDQSR